MSFLLVLFCLLLQFHYICKWKVVLWILPQLFFCCLRMKTKINCWLTPTFSVFFRWVYLQCLKVNTRRCRLTILTWFTKTLCLENLLWNYVTFHIVFKVTSIFYAFWGLHQYDKKGSKCWNLLLINKIYSSIIYSKISAIKITILLYIFK